MGVIKDVFQIFPVNMMSIDHKETMNAAHMSNSILSYKDQNFPVQKSNIGGWQSEVVLYEEFLEEDIELHNYMMFKRLFEEIQEGLSDYVKLMKFKEDHEIIIDSFWFNVNGPEHSNMPHVHSYSYLSGSTYFKSFNDGASDGQLTFYRPDQFHVDATWHPSCLTFDRESNKERIVYGFNNTYDMPPSVGKTYIFPSWLVHSVSPHFHDEERISMAFNTRVQKKSIGHE